MTDDSSNAYHYQGTAQSGSSAQHNSDAYWLLQLHQTIRITFRFFIIVCFLSYVTAAPNNYLKLDDATTNFRTRRVGFQDLDPDHFLSSLFSCFAFSFKQNNIIYVLARCCYFLNYVILLLFIHLCVLLVVMSTLINVCT